MMVVIFFSIYWCSTVMTRGETAMNWLINKAVITKSSSNYLPLSRGTSLQSTPRLKQTGRQGPGSALCVRRTNLSDDLYRAWRTIGLYVFQVELQGRRGLVGVGGCIDVYHLLVTLHHSTVFCHIDCC